MPPVIDKEKCIACNICAQICCMDVFGYPKKGEKPEPLYADECWHCRACVMDCPAGAIDLHYPLNFSLNTADLKEEVQWQ